jgi:hypothetical protein
VRSCLYVQGRGGGVDEGRCCDAGLRFGRRL